MQVSIGPCPHGDLDRRTKIESVVKNADAFLSISQVKSGVRASSGDVNLSVVMHTCSLPV